MLLPKLGAKNLNGKLARDLEQKGPRKEAGQGMRLTSESVFLKAQGPVGARKERRIISRDSYVWGGAFSLGSLPQIT